MSESFVCGGKQIRLDVLGVGRESSGKQPALLLLHGSGGNIGFWLSRLEPALAETGILLFAPHYFDRTGTGHADFQTITDGVHFPLWLETLEAAVQHVAGHPHVDPQLIALVGISLGAFLCMSWAAERSASAEVAPAARCLVELSGGLPEPYASHATRSLPPTLILHGDRDTVVPVKEAHNLAARLQRLSVPHEKHIVKGEGHWFSPAAQWQLLLAVSGFLSRNLLR
jgi:carboxymethylenebutenolidase